MDLFTVAIPGATQKLSFIPSFAIIGVLLFGITATAIFVERFLFILQDRQQTYQKLHSAYKELEESRNLRELGQSVAMINHEIKNYLFMISGYADLLRSSETITAKGERMLNSIVDGTKKLNNFSQDILDLSKSRIIANKKLINISELVRECAQRSFPAQISKFTLPTASEKIYIYADWLKLENAFINMFKNSFEAGAKSICVRMSPQDNVLLVTIEDDGEGCDADALKELFKAFFTTKEKRSGTGLGLPLVKSIVESHGGHISVYSKNLAEDMQATGLKFEITFPIYGTDEKGEDLVPDRQHLPDPDLIVITEGLEQLDTILGIFQNVYMFPTTEKTAADIKFKTYHPQVRIIGTPESIDSVIKRYNVHEGLSIIKATESGLYILSLGEEKSEPHIFSEEYILTHLIETVEPGVAHRGKPQVASTEKITST